MKKTLYVFKKTKRNLIKSTNETSIIITIYSDFENHLIYIILLLHFVDKLKCKKF